MSCDRCGSRGVLAICVRLGDGSEVEFSSCHRCETRVWRSEEGPVSLKQVLELTSANRPTR
ncbi:MAG: hypothetical protein ACRDJF_11425 [Actinomycetota bacterium]